MRENTIKNYNSLCEKARNIIGKHCFYNPKYSEDIIINEEHVRLTPIEQIMYYGLEYLNYELSYIFQNIKLFLNFEKQVSIFYGEKKYIVDFIIKDCIANGERYELKKPLIIECDGFDSHSTKEQLNNDNERENNLKCLGYSILRFTGSKIFNNIDECLFIILHYILGENEELEKLRNGE